MKTRTKRAVIPDEARSGGLMITAPPGWGKSRLLGRRICYQDAQRGVGQVVIDVMGQTIDNFLDKVLYLDRSEQLEIGRRLRYCNMSGEGVDLQNAQGTLASWPILKRRYPDESFQQTAERLVTVIRQIDENFATAVIYGLMRAEPLLRSVCKVLLVNELPIRHAESLLLDPQSHQHLLERATTNVEAREAASDLRALGKLSQRTREERTEPLRNRLNLFRQDSVAAGMFATSTAPSIDWEEVAELGLTVLIDLRGPDTDRAQEFKLFWVWNSLLEYIRRRKSGGHNLQPLSVVIDELLFIVQDKFNTKEIVSHFREILFARRRNANIWLTLATQEQAELPAGLRSACLTMGNQLYGATTDEETAMYRARRFDVLDPYKVKDSQVHFGIRPLMNDPGIVDQFTLRTYGVTGENKTFLSLEEQRYLESRKYKLLPKEDWFFGQTYIEGDVPRHLRKITTRNLDPRQYVNEELVTKLRRRLMRRDGARIADVLTELDASRDASVPQDESFETEARPGRGTLLDPTHEALKGDRPRRTGRRRRVED